MIAFVIALAMPPVLLAQAKTAYQATDITKEFADDAAAAKKKYGTKTVIVEGTIESLPPDQDGKKDVILKGHEAGAGVFCNGISAAVVDNSRLATRSASRVWVSIKSGRGS